MRCLANSLERPAAGCWAKSQAPRRQAQPTPRLHRQPRRSGCIEARPARVAPRPATWNTLWWSVPVVQGWFHGCADTDNTTSKTPGATRVNATCGRGFMGSPPVARQTSPTPACLPRVTRPRDKGPCVLRPHPRRFAADCTVADHRASSNCARAPCQVQASNQLRATKRLCDALRRRRA